MQKDYVPPPPGQPETTFTKFGKITSADLLKIRNMGIDHIDPVNNSDAAVADFAGRLGIREGYYINKGADGIIHTLDDSLVSGGYREFMDNAIYPPCEAGFSMGSFYAETNASWNALPGDAIVTRNTNHPVAKLFSAAGIEFTHSGMATGSYGVRHTTGYEDAMINNVNDDDPANVHVDPQYLFSTAPGAITENLDGTFCKADPDSTEFCPDGEGQKRREFMEENSYVLTTSDAATRSKLHDALYWAKNTDVYYQVYGFSNGVYGNGKNTCSTFVRDALIDSFGSSTFDSYISTPPNLDDVDTLLGTGTSLSWSLLTSYNPSYKAFYYSPETREAGATQLYADIFNTAVEVSAPQVEAEFKENFFLNFFAKIFTNIIVDSIKHVAQNIGRQVVNCFAFNECDNYQYSPDRVSDPNYTWSFDGWKPTWPADVFELGKISHDSDGNEIRNPRPVEEGWAFSADDILYFSAYDRFEKLIETPSSIITSCSPTSYGCSNTVFTNQRGNIDSSIQSCAASMPICACTSSTSCPCASDSMAWLKETVAVNDHTYQAYIGYDNDRIDGNPTSIAGTYHGVYVWHYSPEIKQTLTFTAWHDEHEYYSLAPDITQYPVRLVQANVDLSGDPVPQVTIPVDPGDTITMGLVIEYSLDTKVTWIITSGAHAGTIVYFLPHNSDALVSLHRAVALKYSSWEYE